MFYLVNLELMDPHNHETAVLNRYVLSTMSRNNDKSLRNAIEYAVGKNVFGGDGIIYASLEVVGEIRQFDESNCGGVGFDELVDRISADIRRHIQQSEGEESPAPDKLGQPHVTVAQAAACADELAQSLEALWCAAFDQTPLFSDCSPRFGFRHADGEISFCTMKDVLESGNPRNDSDGEDNAEYLGMVPITMGVVMGDGRFVETRTDNDVAIDVHFYDETDVASTCPNRQLVGLEQGMELLELYTAKQLTPEFFSWSVSKLPQDMWHRFRSMADTMLSMREKATAESFED